MQKKGLYMKISKLFNWRILIIGVLIAFVIFATPFVLSYSYHVARQTRDINQRLLTLWHIETFEGGSVSRSGYLETRTIAFEKVNKGTLFFVQVLSIEQAKNKLLTGDMPDIVSFGQGAGNLFVPYITQSIDSQRVKNSLQECGNINGECKAIPYMIGGYVKISRKEVIPSKSKVCPSELDIESNILDKTPYELYVSFIKGKTDAIIGTQRDLVRVNNRINRGNMNNCNFEYLTHYTDLIQYFAITSNSKSNIDVCNEFIQFMLSEESQSLLNNIGMYPVTEIELYTEAPFSEMENAIKAITKFPNAFEE